MSANGHKQVQLPAVVRALRAQARQTRQRRALVISGDSDWCYQQAHEALAAAVPDSAIWIGQESAAGSESVIVASKARKLLGQEFSFLVYDCHSGFDPDALGIAAGAIAAGGLLLMLTPSLKAWPEFRDPEYTRILPAGYGPETISGRFIRRIARILRDDPSVYVIEQGCAISSIVPATPRHASSIDVNHWTKDQDVAIDEICVMARAANPYPLVIIADRGRGKSAALGIAAARLQRDNGMSIIVTALRRDAVDAVFKHAAEQQHSLEFIAPDELISGNYQPDLLFVDEAAAIPAQMLEKLLERYSRIVFTSTVHGYEGTGRGFVTRFFSLLTIRYPGWKLNRLESPIRWATNDPVEKLVFKMLLLDAEPVDGSIIADARPDRCAVEVVNRDQLIANENKLSELFGLLVAAHYRTRPYDLLNLLDGPNVSGYAAAYGGHVVAAMLLAKEGEIAPELAEQIYLGLRRPRGHLLPQSLAAHGGFPEAATLKYQRVMRIAVHPDLQQRGIGRLLMSAVEKHAKQEGVDIVGASFGATGGLLEFWLTCGYRMARIGLTREHSSGTHSVMVVKGITPKGIEAVEKLSRKLSDQLPWLLMGPLSDLNQDVVEKLSLTVTRNIELDAGDLRDLNAFVAGRRGFEVSYVALAKLKYRLKSNGTVTTLLSEVINNYGRWSTLAQTHGLNGKAGVISALREDVGRYLTPGSGRNLGV